MSEAAGEWYRIRNWKRFQHYKDRNPPWIKLHFELLTSMDWVVLDDASRVLAVASMLVASRNEGVIRIDSLGCQYLQRIAHLNQYPDFQPLIDCGFIEKFTPDASTMLADASTMRQNAIPETETETEEETEEEEPTDSDTTYPHPSVPPTASQPGAPSSNENTLTASTPSPQPSPQKPVFAPYPRFSKAWPGLCAAIQAAHPKARLPKPGSKGERDAQRVLAQLVKVDGYAEGEVLATLKWVLKDDCADALFWRQQVQSVAQLRHRKNNDTMTKFAKIHAKYERFMKGDGHGVESDEDIERYAREVTKGGR